jgi:hypothetical protein
VSDNDQPQVFAATDVTGAEAIDGGRTLAIRLRRADGGESAILLPLVVAQDLSSRIADALSGPPSSIGRSEL